MTLVILAPRLNEPFREDLRLFGWRADEREPGVFAIQGAPWTTVDDRDGRDGRARATGIVLGQPCSAG